MLFIFPDCFHVSNNGQFAGLGATVTHFLNCLLLRKLELCDFRLLLVGFVQQLPTFNPCKLEEELMKLAIVGNFPTNAVVLHVDHVRKVRQLVLQKRCVGRDVDRQFKNITVYLRSSFFG